jgi:phosphatidylethanolamine/phosphatidyl-N-methylethanolamine N-methyltransferase
MARLSRTLGWHPDFAKSDLFDEAEQRAASFAPLPPFGLFTLVQLRR